MSKSPFKLKSPFAPSGDQPEAISKLLIGLQKGHEKQTLLGATGTGKTFTMANVIEKWGKPTLVIAHNKTLAAQLAQEFREFFPDAAVHYFVSYYDFYQPEAYMPITDTYIEKDAQVNKEIDRLRHASTQALLTRKDVIIVASVSCIYGLGSPVEYEKVNLRFDEGMEMERNALMKKLIGIHFERTTADLEPGKFRAVGSRVDIMPISETVMYQIEFGASRGATLRNSPKAKGKVVPLEAGSYITKITKVDPVSSKILSSEKTIFLFPAKHFITDKKEIARAIGDIKDELKERLKYFEKEGKLLEAERLKRRTNYDLAMIREVGYCTGIENYSRHFAGKKEGEPPDTLISYFGGDFLTIIDESHVTLPQLRGMYAGDRSRKETLVEFGFRLPSAKDNRPLRYEEFEERVAEVVYTSATPSDIEKKTSAQIVEQIIRPTGLVDPEVVVRPIKEEVVGDREKVIDKKQKNSSIPSNLKPNSYLGQVQDFIAEAVATIEKGSRVLATTLTKRMAEDLAAYLKDKGMKAEYLHSDVETLDRIKILTRLRKGEVDCLVGVNLLREGLDLPEVELIGILDADKEGFLRSEISLIQTIGRAARNAAGRVILYADNITGSMERAIAETNRRRAIQVAYNKKHGITPQTIKKQIKDITEELETEHERAVVANLKLDLSIFENLPPKAKKSQLGKLIRQKERDMALAVKELDFESAAILRDEIKILREKVGK